MVVTIHQPEHLPWLGFFNKISQADVYVLLDHVQFRKNYYQNRNRIRGEAGPLWLTVPVLTKGRSAQPIREVRINNEGSPRWGEKSWATLLQQYRRAPHWSDYADFFENLYRTRPDRLAELNETIIRYLLSVLSIPVKVLKSSEMDLEGQKGDMILEICRKTGATVYLSGPSGREYLDPDRFARAGMELRFHEFRHPVYPQLHEPFLPCMSTIDMLFNCGPSGREVVRGRGVKTLDLVFS